MEIINPIEMDFLLKSEDLMGVDPDWIEALIQQESAGRVRAMRYEPHYSYLYRTSYFSELNHITVKTEEVLQKTSWGLGQIMGGLARELGLENCLLDLLEPETNLHYMCLNIVKIKKSNLVKTKEDVFSAYNGGLGALSKSFGKYKNQDYVDSVLRHLQSTH